MGKRYDAIGQVHREFIEQQKLFFVATAGKGFGGVSLLLRVMVG